MHGLYSSNEPDDTFVSIILLYNRFVRMAQFTQAPHNPCLQGSLIDWNFSDIVGGGDSSVCVLQLCLHAAHRANKECDWLDTPLV